MLPVSGQVDVEREGKAWRLNLGSGALFATGTRHAQRAAGDNCVLIVNLMGDHVAAPGLFGELEETGRFEISPAIRHLIGFALQAEQEGRDLGVLAPFWVPLLVAALSSSNTISTQRSRLHRLLLMIEAEPGGDFSVARMAGIVGVSPGRLHAIFQAELGSTPRAYLADIRMKRALDILSSTSSSIPDVAFALGFSDQSTLTRAMRRITGATPAEIRRQSREMAQSL
ncbi:MAG: AraC family transcriptional regulator [Burkholderiaceae bacterium]